MTKILPPPVLRRSEQSELHHATDDLVVSPVVPLQGTAAGVVEGAHVHHEVGLVMAECGWLVVKYHGIFVMGI